MKSQSTEQFDPAKLLDEWHKQMDELGQLLIQVKGELVQLQQENQILKESLADCYYIINVCDR